MQNEFSTPIRKKSVSTIHREIKSFERLYEVFKSMPEPQGYIAEDYHYLQIHLYNKNGVCVYEYVDNYYTPSIHQDNIPWTDFQSMMKEISSAIE